MPSQPQKWMRFYCCLLALLMSGPLHAMLSMELTRGVVGAIPIAVIPFSGQANMLPEDIAAVMANDLRNSGRFHVSNTALAGDAIVTGQVTQSGPGHYRVQFQLRDRPAGASNGSSSTLLASQQVTVSASSLRAVAHHFSDIVYQQLTGVRGVFSTRLAYVVVQHPAGVPHYTLEIADEDGYNPRPLLVSAEPIMSPAFSPDGRKIAYVSFENKRAAIYLQEIASGRRTLISAYPGINGAPAFSPDGKKLALVLSKDGSPTIYLMDIATRHLRRLTHDFSINTEPSFSPDGKSLIFTSNRGGTPQIYQIRLADGAISRVTYDGRYNARASFSPDARHIVTINQTSGLFNIALFDMDNGVFRVLTPTSGTDNESPAMAPNGSMVLYGTLYGGRSVLAMVSTDGSIQVRLPGRNGEVQDPAWSPWHVS